jgi:hypothetical protein
MGTAWKLFVTTGKLFRGHDVQTRTFTVIHWRLLETGIFSPLPLVGGEAGFFRTLEVEEQVFDTTSRDPETSARQVAAVVGVFHQCVCVCVCKSSSGSASLSVSRAAPTAPLAS